MSDDNNSRDNDYIHDSDNDRYYYEHYEGMDDYYSQSMGKGSIFTTLLTLILFIVFLFIFVFMVWLIKNIWAFILGVVVVWSAVSWIKRSKRPLLVISFFIALALGLAIFTCSLYIKANFRNFDHFSRYMQLKLTHPGLSDEYDEFRQELKDIIEAADIYTIKDGDYVESVSVTLVFDDIHIGSDSWFNTDVIQVTIQMKEGFDKMYIQDRCQIFVNLRDEIEPVLSELYLSSSYYEFFDTYKYDLKGPYMDYSYMDYRGRELSLRQHTTFSFSDDTYEYSLGYNSVTMKISDTSCREYSFKLLDGQITEFRDLYKEGLIDSNGNIKKDSKDADDSSSGSSGKKDTTSSGSGSGYDPYDVHDYDNADDFADDKYDEFYEYEDDYEDEDEAYDEAEDYWYDEY